MLHVNIGSQLYSRAVQTGSRLRSWPKMLLWARYACLRIEFADNTGWNSNLYFRGLSQLQEIFLRPFGNCQLSHFSVNRRIHSLNALFPFPLHPAAPVHCSETQGSLLPHILHLRNHVQLISLFLTLHIHCSLMCPLFHYVNPVLLFALPLPALCVFTFPFLPCSFPSTKLSLSTWMLRI